MAKPNSSGDLVALRRLLDRLDDVHPKCMPDTIVDQWIHGDPEARQTIEDEIDRLPKKQRKTSGGG